jgi:GDPmannose 4,6-dehydratase
MWRMLQQKRAQDFVIATGESHRLQDFVEQAFRAFGLNWRDHVVTDPGLYRPSEIMFNGGDASKAAAQLDWAAQRRLPDVVRLMAEADTPRAA